MEALTVKMSCDFSKARQLVRAHLADGPFNMCGTAVQFKLQQFRHFMGGHATFLFCQA